MAHPTFGALLYDTYSGGSSLIKERYSALSGEQREFESRDHKDHTARRSPFFFLERKLYCHNK